MLPDITYLHGDDPRGGGWDSMPPEIVAYNKSATPKQRALSKVIACHYAPEIKHVLGGKRADLTRNLRLEQWPPYSRAIIEAGFGPMFRALQVLHGVTLEDVARHILLGEWLCFSIGKVTLDIVKAPASEPDPPYDGDTDYAIIVVPAGMRGVAKASRYHTT